MAAAKSSIAVASVAQPVRQVVTVFLNIGGGGAGTSDEKGADRKLNIAFTPKEFIVRQVTWSGAGTDAVISVINSDLHKDTLLATFAGDNDGAVAPMTAFNMQSRPDSVRFWVTQNGTPDVTDFVGMVSLTLEFRA